MQPPCRLALAHQSTLRPSKLRELKKGDCVKLPRPSKMNNSTRWRWKKGGKERNGATTTMRYRKTLQSREPREGRESIVKGRNLDRAARKAGVRSSPWSCVIFFHVCRLGEVGVGASNSRSTSHLDYDFSQLVHWHSAAAWGCRRLTPDHQYPPVCLRLFSKWSCPPADLCTSSSVKLGFKNNGRDEAAERCKIWEKRRFTPTRDRRMKWTVCTELLYNQGF